MFESQIVKILSYFLYHVFKNIEKIISKIESKYCQKDTKFVTLSE